MAAAAGGVSTSPTVWHHEVRARRALYPWPCLPRHRAILTASRWSWVPGMPCRACPCLSPAQAPGPARL